MTTASIIVPVYNAADLLPKCLAALQPARAGVLGLNWRFYDFLRRARSLGFVIACIPLHVVHLFCAGFGFAWAWLEGRFTA